MQVIKTHITPVAELPTEPRLELDPWPHRHPPYAHQERVFKQTREIPSWPLFMEMGTGKSKVVIDTAGWLFLAGKIDTLVVIAKKGEYATWAYEHVPTHMVHAVPYKILLYTSHLMVSARGKTEVDGWLNTPKSTLRVLVINVESLQYKGGDLLTKVYSLGKHVMMVVDESTCVANHGAKRSKVVYQFAAKSAYRRILSGTPTEESPMNIFGQLLVLGPKPLGHRSFYSFRGEFAILEKTYMGTRQFLTVKGYKNLARLKSEIGKNGTVILKSECLDLPKKLPPVTHHIPLTEEQAKLYKRLAENAMLEFGGKQVEVTNVLAMMTKLHQIVCGQIKTEDGYLSVPNHRIPALVDYLKLVKGKAIVWMTYVQVMQDVITALREEFGEEYVAVFGSTSDPHARERGLAEFKDKSSSKCRVLVASMNSGAFGQNWTAANSTIYYNMSPRQELRRQSEDRTHRIGQEFDCDYTDFVTKGTVDEHWLNLRENKRQVADYVMGRSYEELLNPKLTGALII